MSREGERGRFTGWHAAAWLAGFFGVVVAVNLAMAMLARSSFSGAVVENSYVASQQFNSWLQRAREADRLGWSASVTRRDGGWIAVTLAGAPEGATLAAVARHPLGRRPDLPLTFARDGEGAYVSDRTLPQGRWILRLVARAGEAEWREETEVR